MIKAIGNKVIVELIDETPDFTASGLKLVYREKRYAGLIKALVISKGPLVDIPIEQGDVVVVPRQLGADLPNSLKLYIQDDIVAVTDTKVIVN